MQKLGFIGAGTVGTALAIRLSQKGYPVVAVSSRGRTSAENLAREIPGCRAAGSNQAVADAADIVFITTPDSIIPQVAAGVQWRPGQGVVHCSGAESTAILEPARKLGALTGAIHPLQTFASPGQAIENLPGSTFAVEAGELLLAALKKIALDLDGRWIELEAGDRVLYHAAAVMACNYLVTLVKLSTDLWQTFNVPVKDASQALLPLLQGTLNNINKVGIPECLTGPIARGDTSTVKKHIEALEKAAPEILVTYRELGRKTVPVALAKGKISENQAAEMLALLGTE